MLSTNRINLTRTSRNQKIEAKSDLTQSRKERKENLKSWFQSQNGLALLCELGAFARKYLSHFDMDLILQ